ncbi:hypothetical protein [Winogradskyella psychrotolerans]|uniref:hypothetical protein n=1 Tax=Winogradskyella psychrotolerans TaxID=1344585 RepID=UPI001C06E96A|nr:hypothetical protein [Winogradskyella psychrotolerans]MBU2929627.1 hypothetical protein [Winogradskyella psychrotolerans]
MKTENKILILGLIFSIILITFRIGNGFEFINAQFKFSVIDVAFSKSNQTYLSSAILGYLCFLIFSLVTWKKTSGNGKNLLLIFSLLTFIGIFFELKTFYEGLSGIYNGTHFRIGISLALIGYYISNRMNISEPNKKTVGNTV